MDVVVSQLSDLTMPPSYNQVVNCQDRSLKVVKVAGANKGGLPHPQYSALAVNDNNDVFIWCHRNFKTIKKLYVNLLPKLHPLHVTDYNSSILQVT